MLNKAFYYIKIKKSRKNGEFVFDTEKFLNYLNVKKDLIRLSDTLLAKDSIVYDISEVEIIKRIHYLDNLIIINKKSIK